MADDQDLKILVGGDISPLQDALNQIPAAVQEAAAGASAEIGQLDDALSGAAASGRAAADAMRSAGEAAAGAGGAGVPPIENLGNAADGAANSAKKLDDAWSGVKKAIEGWIGYQAIKSLAESMFDAASTTDRWITGMTVLTGSVTTARNELSALRDMAAQTATPFNEMLAVSQQLTARGMGFEEVTNLLRVAQDAAIATGSSFQTIATALERVETTGQLSNRQIMQLGITWDQLAESMGVSVSEAQAMMKKGGEDAELQVQQLETALGRLKGAGQQAAQDLKGSWQIWWDQFKENLADTGNKIYQMEKNLEDLAGKGKDAFNKVSDSVDPAVTKLQLFDNQIGLQISRVQDLGQGWIVSGKNVTTAMSEQQDALARAQQHLAEVTAAYRAGQASQAEYKAAVDEVTKAHQALDPITSKLVTTFAQLTEKYGEHMIAVRGSAAALAQAQAAYDAARASGAGLAQAQDVLVAAQNKYLAALQTADPLMKSHAGTVAEIGVQYQQAQIRVAAASDALLQAQAAYQQAKASGEALAQAQAVLITAQENYTKALQSADPMLKLHVASLAEMNVAYEQNRMKVSAAKEVLDAARASLDMMRAAAGDTTASIQVLNGVQDVTRSQVASTKVVLDAATSSLESMSAAHGNVARGLALVQQAQENYTAALRAADAMTKGHGASLDALKAKYDENKLAVEAATQTLNEAIAAEDGSAKMAEVVRMAHVNLTDALNKLNEGTKAAASSATSHAAALGHLSTQARETVGTFGEYNVILGATTGATKIHVQSLQELENHERALKDALQIAAGQLIAARNAYDGSGTSLAILNAAQAQFNKLLVEAGPAVKDLTSELGGLAGGYDGVAASAGKAGQAIMSLGQQLDQTMGGMHGALYGLSADMSQLQAMFGGYQGGPLGLGGLGWMAPTIHPGPGVNATIVNGEIVSESQINPGTLSPGGKGSGGTSNSASSIAQAVTETLSTVADAAAVLKMIAQNDFAGAISQLQKDGVSMQNAFADVMGAADAMSQAAQVVQDTGMQLTDLQDRVATSIDTSTANIAASVGVMAQATNTIAQTTQQMAGVVAVTMGVAAASLPALSSTASQPYSTPSVGSLNQYGALVGAPSRTYSSTVGGSITIAPTVNAQGSVFGSGGIQQLAQTVTNLAIDGLRRAGLKF